MKKTPALLLSLILAASLAACGPGGASSVSGEPGSSGSQPAAPADISGEITGEITVSCYDTMQYKSFLEEAAGLFEQKYPGTKVNVETFSAMPEVKTSESDGKKMQAIMVKDDPQGRSDYINKVNTSMMSGGGADVLAMDVLPFHKYIESGQIENLDGYMQADPEFNRSDYRENILDAIAYRGGTWFLPLDYTFDYYAYDTTLLPKDQAVTFGTGSSFTVEKLIELASPSFSGDSLMFNVPDYMKAADEGLFGRMLSENYSTYVDIGNKKANFDDGSFESLLTGVKGYSGKGYVTESVTGQMDAGEVMNGQREVPSARYYFKPKNSFMLSQLYNKNSGRQMSIFIAGTVMGIEEDDDVAGIAADGSGKVPFEFGQAYGINANSKNKQTAWAFIKFLLGEDMQLSTGISTMTQPIRNTARAKKAEMIISGAFGAGGNAMFGGPGAKEGAEPESAASETPALDDAQRAVLEKYTNAVEKLSDQINTYTVTDSIVNDMIAAEAQYFFSGEKSAADVAKTLQSKVDLYLNE